MIKSLLLLIATVAFAAGSFLSQDFDGFDADRYPVPQLIPPLQPIGFAFSIWSVIFLGLFVSAVYSLMKRSETLSWQNFRTPLIVTFLIGAPWVAVAEVAPLTSTFMIFAMLGFAIWAMWTAPQDQPWLAREPIGLLAGWLTAACGVALASGLAGYGIFSSFVAAIVSGVLLIIFALSVIKSMPHFTISYAIAVSWGLFGVILEALINGGTVSVAILAGVGIVVVAGASFLRLRI